MPDGALTRRGFVGAALAVGFAPSALAKVDALTALEALHGGRLGVLVLTGGQRVALSHRPAPVSYTHLDVYKRQVWTR